MNDSPTLLISETFVSRQGEGKLTGTESFFVRTSGCNLRCWFCDTPYASWNPTGELETIDDLLEKVRDSGLTHVVLTGGEPLAAAQVEPLADRLMDAGFHLTIETAGTLEKLIRCDLLSLSPKLADSTPNADEHPRWNELHEQRRLPLQTMKKLIASAKDYQLKFVVGEESVFDELCEVVDRLNVDAANVFVMPQATTVDQLDTVQEWLLPWTESVGFRYCDRMQIRWYGNRRGT